MNKLLAGGGKIPILKLVSEGDVTIVHSGQRTLEAYPPTLLYSE